MSNWLREAGLVMIAASEGKPIEGREKHNKGEWSECAFPSWNWALAEFRIKESAKPTETLTKREAIAALICAGLSVDPNCNRQQDITNKAIEWADDLLAKLNKNP